MLDALGLLRGDSSSLVLYIVAAVVLALLESEIQSGSAALLSEGMKLMKTLLQHATQYEVESRRG